MSFDEDQSAKGLASIAKKLLIMEGQGRRHQFYDHARKWLRAWEGGLDSLAEWLYWRKGSFSMVPSRDPAPWRHWAKREGAQGLLAVLVENCRDLRNTFVGERGTRAGGRVSDPVGLTPEAADYLTRELLEPVEDALPAAILNPATMVVPLNCLREVVRIARLSLDELRAMAPAETIGQTPPPAVDPILTRDSLRANRHGLVEAFCTQAAGQEQPAVPGPPAVVSVNVNNPEAIAAAIAAALPVPEAPAEQQKGQPHPSVEAGPDEWGTPPHLRAVARVLREAGRELTTADLRRREFDMGTLLAASKGCPKEAVEWAQKHLKAGYGRWHWNPPSPTSEKRSRMVGVRPMPPDHRG